MKILLSTRIATPALILSAAAFLVSLFILSPELPERMATHFNAAGRANGWMTKSQHLIFIVSLGFGFPAVLCGAVFSIRFLPTFRDLPEAGKILLGWALWVAALHITWTAFLNERMIEANRTLPPEFASGPAFLLAGLYVAGAIFLIGILAFTLARDKKDIRSSKELAGQTTP